MPIEALKSEILRTVNFIHRGYELAKTAAQKATIGKAHNDLERAYERAVAAKPGVTSVELDEATRALKRMNDKLEARIMGGIVEEFIETLTEAVRLALEALSTLTKP